MSPTSSCRMQVSPRPSDPKANPDSQRSAGNCLNVGRQSPEGLMANIPRSKTFDPILNLSVPRFCPRACRTSFAAQRSRSDHQPHAVDRTRISKPNDPEARARHLVVVTISVVNCSALAHRRLLSSARREGASRSAACASFRGVIASAEVCSSTGIFHSRTREDQFRLDRRVPAS